MTTLRAIKNHIIFHFEDMVVNKNTYGKNCTQFSEKTKWGFDISSFDEGTKKPRWGIVTSVGPSAKGNIRVGDRILIDALKWTEGVSLGVDKFWRTDDKSVLLVDNTNH